VEKEARLKFTKLFCCSLQFGNSKLVKFTLVNVSKDINFLLVSLTYGKTVIYNWPEDTML
jgi:hypothetical protein